MLCCGSLTCNSINAAANNDNGTYYSEPIAIKLPVKFTTPPNYMITGGDPGSINIIRSIAYNQNSDTITITVISLGSPKSNSTVYIQVWLYGHTYDTFGGTKQ